MNDFYNIMNMPEDNRISKPLDKKILVNSSNYSYLSDSLKTIFETCVDDIILEYAFKDNIKNEDLIFLNIAINDPMCVYDIATVLGRTFVYTIVALLNYKGRVKIGLIRSRQNKKTVVTNTIIDINYTGWLKSKRNLGRRNEILEKLNYSNFSNLDVPHMVKKYYEIINEYGAKHVELNNAVSLLKVLYLPYNKDVKKEIITHCVHVRANDSINTQLEMFSTSRLDKFEKGKNDKYMICSDELYCFLQSNYENFRYSYRDYFDYLRSLYMTKRIEKCKSYRTSDSCKYYDEHACTCTYYLTYLNECINPIKCENFKKKRW